MSEWIKVEKATPSKPEVMRIAQDLGIHPDHAFGICMRFWMWCDTHLAKGKLQGVTGEMLDKILGQQGIHKSLTSVGWLVFSGDEMRVPNFERHMSENAKTRASNNLRKTRSRENVSRKCHASSVTKAGPDKIREDKIREEEDTKNPPPPAGEESITTAEAELPPEPRGLDSAECETAADLVHCWLGSAKGGTGGRTFVQILEFFTEQLRLGKSPSAIQRAILDPGRDRTEFLWQFARRELESTPANRRRETFQSSEDVLAAQMADPVQKRILEIAFNGYSN